MARFGWVWLGEAGEVNAMNPDDDEIGDPTGLILVDDEWMPFWLPENVDPDEIGLEWVSP